MIEAPDWRGSVEGILGGIEQELEGPNPDAAMLEDLKVMLDDTRNVIQAYGSAGDTIDYLKALQEIRLRRAIGVCKNVMNDLQAGGARMKRWASRRFVKCWRSSSLT